MAESIQFTKLPAVEEMVELPEGAQLLMEHEGKIYRIPGNKVGGVSLPTGGTTHQMLVKQSDADGDAVWADQVAWKEESLTEVVAENTLTLGNINDRGNNYGKLSGIYPEFVDGETYRVTFNGENYDLLCKWYGGNEEYILGNAKLMGSYDTDYADLPFAIDYKTYYDAGFYVYTQGDGSGVASNEEVTVSVHKVSTTIHPISETYIPSTIARTSDIPEVAQPDWNAAEGAPGHVLNRTHWVEEVDNSVEADVTFISDGGFGNAMTDNVVSDFPFIPEAGKTYTIEYDGVSYECPAVLVDISVVLGNHAYSEAVQSTYSGYDGSVDCPFAIEYYYNGVLQTDFVKVFASGSENGSTKTIKFVNITEIPHPLPPSLGGMPTLAEDGSDAGKVVKANAEGTGYELVSESGLPTLAEDGSDADKYVQVNYKGNGFILSDVDHYYFDITFTPLDNEYGMMSGWYDLILDAFQNFKMVIGKYYVWTEESGITSADSVISIDITDAGIECHTSRSGSYLIHADNTVTKMSD